MNIIICIATLLIDIAAEFVVGGLSSVIGDIVSFGGVNGGRVGKIGVVVGGIVGGAVAPTQH